MRKWINAAFFFFFPIFLLLLLLALYKTLMKFILLLLFSVIVSFSKETQFDPNPDESGPVAGSTPYHPYSNNDFVLY